MRTLVLGGAVSGSAAARLAARIGYRVTVYDANPAVAQSALAEGFSSVGGPWDPSLLMGMELVVVSPGIPERADPITDALEAGLPVWSELEFASRHVDAPLIAVTGTNGKTTVTALIADMLKGSGLRAIAAGNIGLALSDVAGGTWDAVAVEASSFQLRFIDSFHPRVAVVLNLAPDHLDWHGSFAAYGAAKARVFENQGIGDVLVFDGHDPDVVQLVRGAGIRKVDFSGGAGLDHGDVRIPEDAFPVDDEAFVGDLRAAAVAALEAGATGAAVEKTIRDFHTGPHRREHVGTWDGVRWVNDSKATNPHAAVASAESYASVVLIAGGRNKGLDLAPVANVETVRHLILIGESAPELAAAAAAGQTPHTVASSMEEAVAIADGIATSGDTVLLAPGCTSWDMYPSYAARGDDFAELVRKRKELG
jgi:UDP-N-acetylmuramoylalanine--D-glutamate ligase